MAKKIEIHDDLLDELQRLADEKGTSLDQYIEKAIKWALVNRVELDPLFANYKSFAGSTPVDLARNHDDYLYGDTP